MNNFCRNNSLGHIYSKLNHTYNSRGLKAWNPQMKQAHLCWEFVSNRSHMQNK